MKKKILRRLRLLARRLHLEELGFALYRYLRRFPRRLIGHDGAIRRRYMRSESVRKLHLGCGFNVHNGWLNTDFDPETSDVMFLDVTRPFPFSDAGFDYVFSEHLIEHLPFAAGQQMLRESFRVLKPGGTIRISTPDLAFFVDLYTSEKTQERREYIRWMLTSYMPEAPIFEDTFQINNAVRNWGHQFIYDEKVLRYALEAAGFTAVQRREINRSPDAILCGLENERRAPEGVIRMESMIVEASKPG